MTTAVTTAVTCPLCGSTRYQPFQAWENFRVLSCIDCGFHFTDLTTWSYPYTTADYYDDQTLAMVDAAQPHIQRRVREIQRFVRCGRSLDIGCGIGESALAMSAAGFEAEAIDESRRAIDQARALGPKVKWHCGTVLEYADRLGTFDVVTLYHVLEHIPFPLAALEKIQRFVAPGGLLVLEVPNVEGLHARLKGRNWQYFEQHHVNYFSRRHLRILAEHLGFKVLSLSGFYHLSHPQNVWWKDTLKAALGTLGFEDVISITMQAPFTRNGPA
jgi:2-polyprenyl-3-methyl-5-hydroxy-6-metoxy-1,4-benzoquinol methylase